MTQSLMSPSVLRKDVSLRSSIHYQGRKAARAKSEQRRRLILEAALRIVAREAGVERVSVVSAQEMLAAVEQQVTGCDIFIATAAVADYRPVQQVDQKIKKSADTMSVELVRNPDIVATIAARADKPFTVGFAAETQDVLRYAQGKLQAKNLDMIVANDVSRTDIGFNSDDNAVTLLWKDGQEALEKMSKERLALELAQKILQQYQTQKA